MSNLRYSMDELFVVDFAITVLITFFDYGLN